MCSSCLCGKNLQFLAKFSEKTIDNCPKLIYDKVMLLSGKVWPYICPAGRSVPPPSRGQAQFTPAEAGVALSARSLFQQPGKLFGNSQLTVESDQETRFLGRKQRQSTKICRGCRGQAFGQLILDKNRDLTVNHASP